MHSGGSCSSSGAFLFLAPYRQQLAVWPPWEVVKLLAGFGEVLAGTLLRLDLNDMSQLVFLLQSIQIVSCAAVVPCIGRAFHFTLSDSRSVLNTSSFVDLNVWNIIYKHLSLNNL